MNDRDHYWMGLALELAKRGQGRVEPNPMVGCVIVDNNELIASGYHQFFGGPHAEVNAVGQCDPSRIGRSTVYVTLEPCSHFGKTPPCVELLLKHRPGRVVVAMQDPFPQVAGRGIQQLRDNGIPVDVGVGEHQSKDLNAPYVKLIETGMPWVIAKWAMTLDGAIATREHHSQWISNTNSREIVHELRNRVDAVIVGSGTAIADDPLLTTRLPSGREQLRVPLRVIIDRQCRLGADSKLALSVDQGPVVVAVSEKAARSSVASLRDRGCEILVVPQMDEMRSLRYVLQELGKRRLTNVLVEGGGTLLGHAFDEELIDEVHCFIAPKIVGGNRAIRPVGGQGKSLMSEATGIPSLNVRTIGSDIYAHGRVARRKA